MTRASWDDTWLAVAYSIARRSLCSRDQVGAVIVDRRNRVVACSYNGPPASYPYPVPARNVESCKSFCTRGQHGPTEETAQSYADCPSLHAEMNGLLVCDRSVREGGTIYVTSGTCITCAKAITNSGLSRAVVVDTDDDHRRLVDCYEFMRNCGIDVRLVEPVPLTQETTFLRRNPRVVVPHSKPQETTVMQRFDPRTRRKR